MLDVPVFEFSGLGRTALVAIGVLTVVGLICAIRGFWGTSRPARRATILAAALSLPIGVLCGIVRFMRGYQDLARLGPAVTPRDEAFAFAGALGPVFAGLLSAILLAVVGGLGWVRERHVTGTEPPPRKPAR